MSTKKCVELYRQGIWAGSPDSFKNPRDFRKMIRRWARTEDSNGPEALKHKSHNRYGVRRVYRELLNRGITVNHKRVQGIMGIRGLRENVQRKNIILTKVKLENLLTI